MNNGWYDDGYTLYACYSANEPCPDGTTLENDGTCGLRDDKNLGPKDCPADNPVGNPCNPATGNKYQTDEDGRNAEGVPNIRRNYNSLMSADVGLGYGWISPPHRRLELYNPSAFISEPMSIHVRHADGRSEPFFKDAAGAWKGDADGHTFLSQDASGYTVAHTDGSSDRYDTAGRLLTETSRSGQATTYTYDTNGKLASITGPFGHTLTFAYDAASHVSQITDSASGVYSYVYDATNNLIRVTYPDGSGKRYHYENASFPHHLTGISFIDANGVITRYGTYSYDTNGKAISTEHAGGAEKFTLSYNSDTQTTVTDAVGTPEVMTFAPNLGVKNLVSKINQGDGKGIAQTFDANNNLTCKQDEEGRVTTYTYNGTNQRLSMTEGQTGSCGSPISTSATRTTSYQYLSTSLDLPTQIQSPSVNVGQNKTVTIGYDANRNPTSITQSGFTLSGSPISRSIALSYNPQGQVTSIDGPRTDVADITTLSYNNCATGVECGQLSSITNALGHATTFDSYDGAGRVTQSADPNGLRTNYAYDGRGRVVTVTQTPLSGTTRITQYNYNAANNVTFVTFPDGRTLTYSYDAAQTLRQVTDNLGNKVTYNYDLKGNRTQEQVFDPDNTLVRAIDTAYDLRNRTASINAAGSLSQTLHDAIGNLVSQTDPKNNPPTTHQYDALNRIVQTLDALGGTTGYGYDTNDRLKQVIAPNNATTQYEYDDLGNLLKEVSGDRGTTNYTYDEAGNVKTVTDARNITVSYTYDALNRITLIDHPTDTDVTYSYDTGTNCTLGKGRLCQVIDESGTTQYGYDAFGNTTEQRKVELTKTYITRYTYDLGDRIVSITYPDNRVITYARDSAGRIASITATVNGSTQTLVSGRTYRADGLFLSQTYGNGINEIRQYNTKGELTYQSVGTADTRVYTYDPNGNLTQKQALPEVGNYLYDALDRLTRDQIVTGTTSNQVYVYDANGNRTKKASTVYTYTANTNRLVQTGTTALTLDAAGNTLTNGNLNYTYSNAGRLRQAYNGATLKGTYTYNHLGQRTRKVAGTTTTVFHYDIFGNLILETSNTAVVKVAYFYADTTPIAHVKRASNIDTLSYIHTDHLTTPRLATNTAGVKVWSWEGRAFGDTNPNQNPDGDGITVTINLRGDGLYADSETGLHYGNDRYYDPKSGRWITADRMTVAQHVNRSRARFGKGSRLSPELNPYAYGRNNPLRFTDPTGKVAIADDVIIIGGAVIISACAASPGCRQAISNAAKACGDAIDRASDMFSDLIFSRPRGFWPGDSGAEEWGRRNDVGAAEGRRRFHQGVKQADNMSRPRDDYSVNPETGDVADPEGEVVGNLNDS